MNIKNMKEKKQNSISEEKSSSDNKESVENKEKMEQKEILYKEDEINPSTNEEFQDRLSKENEGKIPSKCTKVNDIIKKKKKMEKMKNLKYLQEKYFLQLKKKLIIQKRKEKAEKHQPLIKKINIEKLKEEIKFLL